MLLPSLLPPRDSTDIAKRLRGPLLRTKHCEVFSAEEMMVNYLPTVVGNDFCRVRVLPTLRLLPTHPTVKELAAGGVLDTISRRRRRCSRYISRRRKLCRHR
jgi:hypothetical protein